MFQLAWDTFMLPIILVSIVCYAWYRVTELKCDTKKWLAGAFSEDDDDQPPGGYQQ